MSVVDLWRVTGLVMVLVFVASGMPAVYAQSRPLGQLPADLWRWSTVWAYVPQQMYAVGIDHGPVAAVTWGPAKGAVLMIHSTTQDVWNAAQPDDRPGRRDDSDMSGPLFRYDF